MIRPTGAGLTGPEPGAGRAGITNLSCAARGGSAASRHGKLLADPIQHGKIVDWLPWHSGFALSIMDMMRKTRQVGKCGALSQRQIKRPAASSSDS